MAKETNMLYLYAGIILLYGCYKVIFRRKKGLPSPTPKKLFIIKEEAEQVVNQLNDLDYFKYADDIDITSLKAELTSTISEHGVLSTICDDKTHTPKDYRYYHLDGEDVFEEGGFKSSLEDMKGTFDKIGLKFDVTNHIEGGDTITGYNHELTVNGKQYVIFHEFQDNIPAWGEAAQRFAEMVNDQLEIQNKDERLYLINGGNDGSAVFLTEPQFQLLDKLFIDDEWKPLPVDRWSRFFGIQEY